jgi:predicted nuclease of restriction endonuclease-like (RecB) superfamily
MKLQSQFTEVIRLIKKARSNAYQAVNTEMINLYWSIGEYISKRVEVQAWGKSVVTQLATYIEKKAPDLKGYSHRNLWRMKQFYETYRDYPKLSKLLREISWSHNLAIMARCKTMKEREFYLLICKKEQYGFRELDRQISTGLFERSVIGKAKLSTVLRELTGTKKSAKLLQAATEIASPKESTKLPTLLTELDINNSFKDSYVFEFLNLLPDHDENQLQKALISHMKNFILELGRDFVFMAEEYRLEVGNSDFEVDLLFYHRDLQCLVAIELKTDKFKPEFLGKLNFYLEALDKDVKKPHENPSIGILLCKDQDSEVVKYALSRSLSPALVAAYETQLPDKKLLQRKLHELMVPQNSDT